MTPTSDSASPLLVDTSVAIAVVLSDHKHHEAAAGAVDGRARGLAGHAAFETFSVLTRLPIPFRRTPAGASSLLSENFPDTRFLSAERALALLASLGAHRIAGGAVYDALVGAVALEHGLRLMTRDRRALPTYRALGVEVEVVD